MPAPLKAGDTIAFLSPASPPCYIYNCSEIQNHIITAMKDIGDLKVEFGKHAWFTDGYLAGSDENRAEDLMNAFKDPNIKAIVAIRGGWGCNRLLGDGVAGDKALLDFDVIRKNPKPLVGYSDLTGLLTSIQQTTGMITFHGPMGIDDWTNENSLWFKKVLMNSKEESITLINNDEYKSKLITIVGGKSKGRLLGGNLSVFNALIGSKYLPLSAFDEAILFLEDVDEDPEHIDRMLTTLRLAGFMNRLNGIVWGICNHCEFNGSSNHTLSMKTVLEQHFSGMKIPVLAGAMIGHINAQWTLPVGGYAELDADKHTLTLQTDSWWA